MIISNIDAKAIDTQSQTRTYRRRLHGKDILGEEGDLTGKKWDEELLRQWEEIENGGQTWTGRSIAP